jgi:Inositol monophosphatase family
MSKSAVEKALLLSLGAASAAALLLCISKYRKKNPKHVMPKHLLISAFQNELELAITLAVKAGENMYKYCDEKGTEAEADHDLSIATKGQPEDFCTRIDLENEKFVTEGLLKEFPNHEIIAEESVGNGPVPPLTDRPTWIVDPIDGTTNFASGYVCPCCVVRIMYVVTNVRLPCEQLTDDVR